MKPTGDIPVVEIVFRIFFQCFASVVGNRKAFLPVSGGEGNISLL